MPLRGQPGQYFRAEGAGDDSLYMMTDLNVVVQHAETKNHDVQLSFATTELIHLTP